MENTNLIGIKDLQELCNVKSPQVMLQWVKTNLSKLNQNGEHACKCGKRWLFDEIAVSRVLELRRVSSTIQTTHVDNDKIAELERENKRLQDNLVLAQTLVAQRQQELLALKDNLLSKVELLTEAKTNVLEAKAHTTVLENKVELLETRVMELTQEKEKLLSMLSTSPVKKKKRKKRKK